MTHTLILACGNSLRGDDGVGLHIARSLRVGEFGSDLEICEQQQWTPELTEPISRADLAIFVDAAAVGLKPGELRIEPIWLQDVSSAVTNMTHTSTPAQLLALTQLLYGKNPHRSFLLTIGGKSFEYSNELSEPVRQAIPIALDRIKGLIAGVSCPPVSPNWLAATS